MENSIDPTNSFNNFLVTYIEKKNASLLAVTFSQNVDPLKYTIVIDANTYG